jgi:L-histidine Nalpha-methyltransferase
VNELDQAIVVALTSSPKRIPTLLLYDDLGSALFEAITLLPEYEVTRAGKRLLRAHSAELKRSGEWTLVELGPGAGSNAVIIMQASGCRRFVGIDVSRLALRECAKAVEPFGSMQLIESTYLEGLERAARCRGSESWTVAFLGSNLSNFSREDAADFFVKVHKHLRPGDSFLIATDLEKPPELLVPAYDDALGVTAAFNKNMLTRLNREYGANFDARQFDHHAVWNGELRRMEMHLKAREAMDVSLTVLDLHIHINEGEGIFTEASHRFSTDELNLWAERAGFHVRKQWLDKSWPFALTLYVSASGTH